MLKQKLGQTEITTSRLGFGCAQLTTHPGRRDAIRILETAFAAGITHFDVARIYGLGRAEGIVGEFLRGKRDRITLATKFGIQPSSGVSGNRRAISLAKKILGPFPGLLRRARQRSSNMVRKGDFTPQNAVKSLEISLRELGTDSIDLFFLHEATLADAASEPLIETMQQQVNRGTIRTFGIASAFPNFQADASRVPSAYRVLQFEGDAVSRNVSHLTHREGLGILTHSIFKPFSMLRAAIKAQPAVAREYSSRMDLDLTDSSVIGSLLLQGALRENS